MSYILAFGIYFLMAIANLVELVSGEGDMWYSRIITLFIGCSIAPLTSIVNATLINPYYFSINKVITPLVANLFFAVITIWVYEQFSALSPFFIAAFTIFVVYYIFIMIKYTIIFLRNYRDYGIRVNNYYSDPEGKLLHWVFVSQFIATGSGLAALITLFLPPLGLCLFAVFINVFYPYYAIRFINYGFYFPAIAPVMRSINEVTVSDKLCLKLESAVDNWEKQKCFLESDLNIESVSRKLGTNRTYLSSYINNNKQKSFKEWISGLRIAEAQRLLIADPFAPISEIAHIVGFSDKGNFANRFSKSIGTSPSKWRAMKSNRTDL